MSEASKHVSMDQAKAVIDFMGKHVEFASGTLRTLEARHVAKRLWGDLAKILNNRGGVRKTADGWSRYWSDFKNKLKKKLIVLKRKGPGAVKPLSRLEKRALVILGPHFEKRISRDYTGSSSNNFPPEVKLEAYNENNTSEFSKAQSDSSDRLSGCDRDSDDNGESYHVEYVEEDDRNVSEHDSVIQNLYPKWLIEVEKKRADAELIRARAEEERVAVAAKTAEAAAVQAEALKKLSEAATVQADALMRIALLLESRESRSHQDILAI